MDALYDSFVSDDIRKVPMKVNNLHKLLRKGSQPQKHQSQLHNQSQLRKQKLQSNRVKNFQALQNEITITVSSPIQRNKSIYSCLTNSNKRNQQSINVNKNSLQSSKSQKIFDKVLQLTSQKSDSNLLIRRQKVANQQSQYYLYWKNKANQFQEENFKLLKINSKLQQQLLYLKEQNDKIKTHEKLKQKIESKSIQKSEYLQLKRLNRIYSNQLSKLKDQVAKQQLLIEKQISKIKQIEKFGEENKLLNKLLQNFEQIAKGERKKMEKQYKEQLYKVYQGIKFNDKEATTKLTEFHERNGKEKMNSQQKNWKKRLKFDE